MHEGVDIVEHTVRSVLHDVLGISEERLALFAEATPLFGALPELDSMAVAGLLTELEDRLGIIIEDDDVDGETFETLGSLVRFAADKALG
ncbi:acyl carrier protein [Rhizorhapis suberifaciens]|uniref:Acyl carrier protein n=1 Tax=Rhizorhapis suberifaciens TaxID=13656 RepID=A0A840HXI3_9SPHN|nr:phosphopantetheine-binding protein [Rhizorhapis suberifaciens]MBB4642104.1 acyl carrier protein [Rhizorhapis suberifaciens]